jgi:hypothetical protein
VSNRRSGNREIHRAFVQTSHDGIRSSREAKDPNVETPSQSPSVIASPIEGVGDDEWSDFVAALRTQDPSYATERHIGAYEHNRGRLKTLGIEEPKTEAEQYKALETDLMDHYNRTRKLINEQCGECINIDGQDMFLSASGCLALLKAAGPTAALDWLKNPDVRNKFPRTKELIKRANGIF